MILLPLLVIVMVGYLAYRVWQRQPHPAGGMAGGPSVAAPQVSFWPTTVEGKLGLGAFASLFGLMALVNVVTVPFLSWIVGLAGLVLTGVARLARHDRSVSVLIVLVVMSLAVVASLLFLGGEVFIGHD